ncbi:MULTISPECIES: GAF and ANTAR domain-containing protein [unclassified Streptomyces]|uniref:GAF and ANTAR domain-containing protein n=1 Tax=unclassified Streptomyces TaxID=2593676 RepID=UPI0033BDF190
MPKRFVVAVFDFSELPRYAVDTELAEALSVAAQQLHETSTSHHTLRTAVRLAVHILPGAQHADVSVLEREAHRRTVAWTDELVRTAAALSSHSDQREHWSDLWTTPVARIEDSAAGDEGREPSLSGLGLRSVLSMRLRAERRKLTVLTVYAREPGAFDESATRIGRLFTAHVSIALNSVTVREQLTEAMRTRDLIGQATGILMERLDIDAAEAFDSLVRASQQENVKLRDIARRIVDARDAR